MNGLRYIVSLVCVLYIAQGVGLANAVRVSVDGNVAVKDLSHAGNSASTLVQNQVQVKVKTKMPERGQIIGTEDNPETGVQMAIDEPTRLEGVNTLDDYRSADRPALNKAFEGDMTQFAEPPGNQPQSHRGHINEKLAEWKKHDKVQDDADWGDTDTRVASSGAALDDHLGGENAAAPQSVAPIQADATLKAEQAGHQALRAVLKTPPKQWIAQLKGFMARHDAQEAMPPALDAGREAILASEKAKTSQWEGMLASSNSANEGQLAKEQAAVKPLKAASQAASAAVNAAMTGGIAAAIQPVIPALKSVKKIPGVGGFVGPAIDKLLAAVAALMEGLPGDLGGINMAPAKDFPRTGAGPLGGSEVGKEFGMPMPKIPMGPPGANPPGGGGGGGGGGGLLGKIKGAIQGKIPGMPGAPKAPGGNPLMSELGKLSQPAPDIPDIASMAAQIKGMMSAVQGVGMAGLPGLLGKFSGGAGVPGTPQMPGFQQHKFGGLGGPKVPQAGKFGIGDGSSGAGGSGMSAKATVQFDTDKIMKQLENSGLSSKELSVVNQAATDENQLWASQVTGAATGGKQVDKALEKGTTNPGVPLANSMRAKFRALSNQVTGNNPDATTVKGFDPKEYSKKRINERKKEYGKINAAFDRAAAEKKVCEAAAALKAKLDKLKRDLENQTHSGIHALNLSNKGGHLTMENGDYKWVWNDAKKNARKATPASPSPPTCAHLCRLSVHAVPRPSGYAAMKVACTHGESPLLCHNVLAIVAQHYVGYVGGAHAHGVTMLRGAIVSFVQSSRALCHHICTGRDEHYKQLTIPALQRVATRTVSTGPPAFHVREKYIS